MQVLCFTKELTRVWVTCTVPWPALRISVSGYLSEHTRRDRDLVSAALMPQHGCLPGQHLQAPCKEFTPLLFGICCHTVNADDAHGRKTSDVLTKLSCISSDSLECMVTSDFWKENKPLFLQNMVCSPVFAQALLSHDQRGSWAEGGQHPAPSLLRGCGVLFRWRGSQAAPCGPSFLLPL